jgi:hypothetical protein
LATVTEVGAFDDNDGDSENVLWFHYTDSSPGEEGDHHTMVDGVLDWVMRNNHTHE